MLIAGDDDEAAQDIDDVVVLLSHVTRQVLLG